MLILSMIIGLNLFIRSQDIEQKPNSDVNQGPLLCCRFAKNKDLQYYLVNDNVYTKFGLNLFFRSRDIEQKPNSDVNQGL